MYFLKPIKSDNGYQLSLVFAGSFLFAVTMVHLLPEIFSMANGGGIRIGIYLLLGYFFQQILELFSSGIEHGHLHTHGRFRALPIILALSIHAFLEGGLLAHPSQIHSAHSGGTLLIGVGLHKIPAAFALMTVIMANTDNRRLSMAVLTFFALMSPLGFLISDYASYNNMLSSESKIILMAIVCGSFLHISTTIVFESSPQHRFDLRRFLVAGMGAAIAILVEVI